MLNGDPLVIPIFTVQGEDYEKKWPNTDHGNVFSHYLIIKRKTFNVCQRSNEYFIVLCINYELDQILTNTCLCQYWSQPVELVTSSSLYNNNPSSVAKAIHTCIHTLLSDRQTDRKKFQPRFNFMTDLARHRKFVQVKTRRHLRLRADHSYVASSVQPAPPQKLAMPKWES